MTEPHIRRLRNGKQIDISSRRQCNICLQQRSSAQIQRVLSDHGRCMPSGQYVGPRCRQCHELSLRAWVRREWDENEEDWMDDEEVARITAAEEEAEEAQDAADEAAYQAEHRSLSFPAALHSATLVGDEIERLVRSESLSSGYTPTQAAAFATMLASYTEALISHLERG